MLVAHALTLALIPSLARADLKLDDDVSPVCQSICRPVRQLGETCDVDDDLVRDRVTEDLLTLQCYCLNNSFDVRSITGLCASCIQQNPTIDSDDGRPEDDDIRGTCFFFLFPFFASKPPPSHQKWKRSGKTAAYYICTSVS